MHKVEQYNGEGLKNQLAIVLSLIAQNEFEEIFMILGDIFERTVERYIVEGCKVRVAS